MQDLHLPLPETAAHPLYRAARLSHPTEAGFVGHWQRRKSMGGSAYSTSHPTGREQKQMQVKECFGRQHF